MREIREVYNRASAFHVHLLKCQFEQGGIDHSDSEREDNGSMNSEISPTPALEPLLFGTEKEARSFYDCAKSAMLENYENSSGDPLVTFTLDSASDIHVIQLKEAIKYFSEKSDSNLKVLGVSGNVTRADLQGHLVRGPTHVTQTDVWVSRGDTLSLFKRRGNPCSGDALC